MTKQKTKKKWYEKHHEECNALRAKYGAKEGDGLRRLTKMKLGSPAEREMAKLLEKSSRDAMWSVDMLDAIVGAYASSPLMSFILGGKLQDNGNIVPFNPLQHAAFEWAKTCQSSAPTPVKLVDTSLK